MSLEKIQNGVGMLFPSNWKSVNRYTKKKSYKTNAQYRKSANFDTYLLCVNVLFIVLTSLLAKLHLGIFYMPLLAFTFMKIQVTSSRSMLLKSEIKNNKRILKQLNKKIGSFSLLRAKLYSGSNDQELVLCPAASNIFSFWGHTKTSVDIRKQWHSIRLIVEQLSSLKSSIICEVPRENLTSIFGEKYQKCVVDSFDKPTKLDLFCWSKKQYKPSDFVAINLTYLILTYGNRL